MTKNSTKKALLMSCLSLLLCMSMLVGTTFAWFTDTASTGVNTIVSGNLDVELYYSTDMENWNNAAEATDIFDDEALYEPGYTEVVYLKVVNEGNLDMKYKIGVNVLSETAGINQAGQLFNLSDYLQYGIVETSAKYADREAAREAIENPTGFDGMITEYQSLLEGKEYVFAMVVWMPEATGNVANHNGVNVPEIQFTIQVQATQLNSEEDSFGPDYDLNAPALISINGVSYDTLSEAIEAASEGDVITVGGNVSYDMGSTTGGKDWSKVSIVAETDSGVVPTITFTGYGSANPLKNAKISGVKIVDNTVGDAESAWEHGYLEVEGGTYTNVEFVNAVQANGTVTFDGCTFNGNANEYGAWVNSGNATFTNCTFVGARALKAHEQYGSEVSSVTVEGCAFNAISKKPGIALGDLNADTTVTLKNNTFIDCQPGDQNLYIYETDTDVSSITFVNENNTAEVTVYTVDEWVAVSNAVDGKSSNFDYLTIKLGADLDFTGYTGYIPVSRRVAKAPFAGTFDGQGHTISGLKFGSYNGLISNVFGEGADLNKDHYYTFGLFAEAGNGVVFKNFTLSNCYFGNYCSDGGFVVGDIYNDATFENITIESSLLVQARQVGGIVGQIKGENAVVAFNNCKVNNSAVLAIARNEGILYGYAPETAQITITGCSTTGSVVTNTVKTDNVWSGGIQHIYSDWVTYLAELTLESALADTNFTAATIN